IVDDCALTGLRFKTTIQKIERPQIGFFHLLSDPALRNQMMAVEEKVTWCLAASDLYERVSGNSQSGKGLPAALAQDRYLIKDLIQPIFPWNEPAMPIVMPFSDEIVDGWHLFPPHLVYKNRHALDLPPLDAYLAPVWQVPSRIAYRWHAKRLTLLQLDTQESYVLADQQAAIWRMLAVYGEVPPMTNTNMGGAMVQPFVHALVQAKLIEHCA
ncbi:MAG: hypothetical protein AAF633_10135, partial [Chloroflexota bacterium]